MSDMKVRDENGIVKGDLPIYPMESWSGPNEIDLLRARVERLERLLMEKGAEALK